MTRSSWIALALCLTACAAPQAGNGEAGTYTIGPDGAARLSEATPFTVPALKRAFPGLDVVSFTTEAGAPVFHIRQPGSDTPLYIVTPDWTRGYAGAVATETGEVSGPGGLRTGTSQLGDVPAGLKTSCAPPEAEGEIDLVCESGRFRVEFAGEGENAVLIRQTFLPPLP